jgi:hypothetical protein
MKQILLICAVVALVGWGEDDANTGVEMNATGG